MHLCTVHLAQDCHYGCPYREPIPTPTKEHSESPREKIIHSDPQAEVNAFEEAGASEKPRTPPDTWMPWGLMREPLGPKG